MCPAKFDPHTWLAHHASERPDQIALISYPEQRRSSWRALAMLEADLIDALQGIEPGCCIALDLPNGARFLAALAACDALGLTPAPLHRRWAAPTRASALALLGASALIHDAGVELLEHARVMPVLEDDALHPACVLFTSGSTGEPRAVPLSHRNIATVLDQFELGLGLTPAHVLGAIAPWYHVAGLCTMTLPLWRLGAKIVCFESFDVAQFSDAMRATRIDATFMVPTMWEALRQSEDFERGVFDALQIALTGGARAPFDLLRAWHARGVSMVVGYGMTEAAPMVTLATATHWLEDPLSVGDPDPRVEVRIEQDQILVRGPNVTHGYLNETSLDRERWDEQGFFITRDLGQWASDGSLRYLGRADEVIVSGAEKIAPVEVEAAIEQIDGQHTYVVLGMPDAYWGEVVTLVSLTTSPRRDISWWREMLDTRIERYKMPRMHLEVEAWPLGATGKIDRVALRRLLMTGREEASR